MRSFRTWLIGAALIVLAAGYAAPLLADDPAAPFETPGAEAPAEDDPFTSLDKNQDGAVTHDEVPDEHRRLLRWLMAQADANGDGRLSREELAAGMAQNPPAGPPADRPPAPRKEDTLPPERPKAGQVFKRFDINGDGQVTEDEMPGPRRPLFARLLAEADGNKDGALNKEEFAAAYRKLARKGRLPAAGPPPDAAPPDGLGRRLMRALDADGNGEISSSELAAAPQGLAQLDKDGDGALSPPELHGPLPREQAGGPPRAGQVLARVMQSDENGDGRLSKDECPPRLERAFDRLDGDGDGFLDRDELRAGLAALARAQQRRQQDEQNPPGNALKNKKKTGKQADN